MYQWGVASSYLPFVSPAAQPALATEAPGLPPAAIELEAAHAELRRAALALEHDVPPVIDLAPAARALEQAFSSLYDAFDARADRMIATREAASRTDDAASLLAPALAIEEAFGPACAALGRARAHLGRAEERLARVPPVARPEAPDLMASLDAPRLHVVERPSLAPAIRVPKAPPAGSPAPPAAPLPEPRNFVELREVIAEMKKQAGEAREQAARPALPAPSGAEPRTAPRPPPPGFAKDVAAAIDDAAFVRARTREHFEEVAMVGMQRAPLLGDAWRSSLTLERRMLASIDVITAFGPTAIAHVPRLVADAPVKDPTRAFGIAMVLGCIAGRDALAAAEHALLSSERDAAFVSEIGAAWKLVPHDLLPLALRTLLADPDPAIRAMAIDVLAHRGLATPAELARAAADVPVVAAKALVHLAFTPSPELPALIHAAAETSAGDAALREAVWTAMALSDQPSLSYTLSAALDAGGPDADAAALLLALAGDDDDARRLSQRALAAPTPSLVTAAGWAGGAWSVGPMIELLASDDDEVKAAAAAALDRITGAGIVEKAPVDEEEILVDDPPEPDVGEPRQPKLARVISDPRDVPPEPKQELIEQPSTDPARWRAWWIEKGASWDMNARYRRGKPYTPLVSLAELDGGACTFGDRRLLQRELVIRTGSFVRFDPHDLVVVQEEALRAWQPVASRQSGAPGRWVRPMRRTA